MTEEFLDLELRLLILRYGKERVIRALAKITDQSPDEFKNALQVAERKSHAPTKSKRIRRKPSLPELTAAAAMEQPEKAESLRHVMAAFASRTFLPKLRDVDRFLDKRKAAHGRIKSRDSAGPVVIHALIAMSIDELNQLAATTLTSGESDYTILAREIMKPGSGRSDR